MFDDMNHRIALSFERALLLWCMRIWDMGSRRPAGPAWQVAEVLAELDASEAAPAFDSFMRAVSRTATRVIMIGCVYAPCVSEDEAALLDTLALAQEQRAFEAMLLLRELVSPIGALEASASAHVLAAALAKAGRVLRAPSACTRRFAMPGTGGSIRPMQAFPGG